MQRWASENSVRRLYDNAATSRINVRVLIVLGTVLIIEYEESWSIHFSLGWYSDYNPLYRLMYAPSPYLSLTDNSSGECAAQYATTRFHYQLCNAEVCWGAIVLSPEQGRPSGRGTGLHPQPAGAGEHRLLQGLGAA